MAQVFFVPFGNAYLSFLNKRGRTESLSRVFFSGSAVLLWPSRMRALRVEFLPMAARRSVLPGCHSHKRVPLWLAGRHRQTTRIYSPEQSSNWTELAECWRKKPWPRCNLSRKHDKNQEPIISSFIIALRGQNTFRKKVQPERISARARLLLPPLPAPRLNPKQRTYYTSQPHSQEEGSGHCSPP
jgi:hypothetical protein